MLIIGGKEANAITYTETMTIESTELSWVESPALPEPRESMSSVLFHDGAVCIYGGFGLINDGAVQAEKSVFCSRQPFGPTSETELSVNITPTVPWTLAGNLLESKRMHTSVLHHSKSGITST